MSGIWQLLLQFGSDHPDKQNNYKWFVIVNLPQRTLVKASEQSVTSKHSNLSVIFLFFIFVLIEHVTFLFPGAAYSQMVENKQDLPKELVEPFGSSCQFESEGIRVSFLSERKSIQAEGRNAGLGGFVVLVWEAGALFKKRKVQ